MIFTGFVIRWMTINILVMGFAVGISGDGHYVTYSNSIYGGLLPSTDKDFGDPLVNSLFRCYLYYSIFFCILGAIFGSAFTWVPTFIQYPLAYILGFTPLLYPIWHFFKKQIKRTIKTIIKTIIVKYNIRL